MKRKLTAEQCKEIDALRRGRNGLVRPLDLLKVARDPACALHCLFTWSNAKAAHEHRLQQARHVLQLYVRIGPVVQFANRRIQIQRRMLVSLPDQRKEKGGGYNYWEEIRKNPELYRAYVEESIAELVHWVTKHQGTMPKDFACIFRAIEQIVIRYNKTASKGKRKKAV